MCVTVASVVFCTRIAANPQRLLRLILQNPVLKTQLAEIKGELVIN